jgi:hydroxymethylbilane synthase
VGALAEVVEGEAGEELWIRAVALAPDGSVSIRRSASGSPADPAGVGRTLAAEMVADGAADLIVEAGPPGDPRSDPRADPAEDTAATAPVQTQNQTQEK